MDNDSISKKIKNIFLECKEDRKKFFEIVVDYLTPTSKEKKTNAEKESLPNIILIMTDQQTADAMSCAGNKNLLTPALDTLAADGIRFTHNYVTQPLCLPFRTSLQTARYPHEVNVRNSMTNYGNMV